MKYFLTVILSLTALFAFTSHADEAYDAALKELAKTKVATLVASATVQSAIKAQNSKNASLSEGDVIKLDKQWRAENKSSTKPLIDATLNNSLSKFLTEEKQKSEGLYTEIFVMDNKGLNVGQSDITSDYWQGDEAKWQKTYSVGPGAVHIGELKKDESTQEIQVQLSVAITDSSNTVIGAITLGINLDNL